VDSQKLGRPASTTASVESRYAARRAHRPDRLLSCVAHQGHEHRAIRTGRWASRPAGEGRWRREPEPYPSGNHSRRGHCRPSPRPDFVGSWRPVGEESRLSRTPQPGSAPPRQGYRARRAPSARPRLRLRRTDLRTTISSSAMHDKWLKMVGRRQGLWAYTRMVAALLHRGQNLRRRDLLRIDASLRPSAVVSRHTLTLTSAEFEIWDTLARRVQRSRSWVVRALARREYETLAPNGPATKTRSSVSGRPRRRFS